MYTVRARKTGMVREKVPACAAKDVGSAPLRLGVFYMYVDCCIDMVSCPGLRPVSVESVANCLSPDVMEGVSKQDVQSYR